MTDTAPEEMVKRLEPIMDALGAFYEPAGAVVWLTSPQTLLEGRVPLDLIREGDEPDVMDLVCMMRDGVYP